LEASVAELFPHVRIVMGMVVGLGITRLLMGYAGLIQHPARAKLSLIHLLWSFSVLVELVLFWWWEFELYGVQTWNFGLFAFLIGYAVTLFLLAALLFPDKLDDYDGYEDFFLKRRHWFFSILAVTFLLDVLDTLVKGEPYFDTLGIQYLIQVPAGIALAILAIRTPNRNVHLGLVILHLCYQAWWIYLLFNTHA
jgi:hypothetical protein